MQANEERSRRLLFTAARRETLLQEAGPVQQTEEYSIAEVLKLVGHSVHPGEPECQPSTRSPHPGGLATLGNVQLDPLCRC